MMYNRGMNEEKDNNSNGKQLDKDPKTGHFAKGHKLAKGRQFGQKNYATLYKEALIRIATERNKSVEELESELVGVGIEGALSKNVKFFQDTLDRVHGKASQSIDVTTGGEKIQGLSKEEQLKLNKLFDEENKS